MLVAGVRDYKTLDKRDPLRYVGLVKKMAAYYADKSPVAEMDDLVSDGMVAVITALENVDDKYSNFSTFIYNKIKSYLYGRIYGVFKHSNCVTSMNELDGTNGEEFNIIDLHHSYEQEPNGYFSDNIIKLISGIRGYDWFVENMNGASYVEIAKRNKMSRQRVHQKIQAFKDKAQKKLKQHWKEIGAEPCM